MGALHSIPLSFPPTVVPFRIGKTFKSCSKSPSDTVYWTGMHKIPCPIQKLCLGERERALDCITEGVRPTLSLADDLSCDCHFFQKRQLLCDKMWTQEEFLGGGLDQDHM